MVINFRKRKWCCSPQGCPKCIHQLEEALPTTHEGEDFSPASRKTMLLRSIDQRKQIITVTDRQGINPKAVMVLKPNPNTVHCKTLYPQQL